MSVTALTQQLEAACGNEEHKEKKNKLIPKLLLCLLSCHFTCWKVFDWEPQSVATYLNFSNFWHLSLTQMIDTTAIIYVSDSPVPTSPHTLNPSRARTGPSVSFVLLTAYLDTAHSRY